MGKTLERSSTDPEAVRNWKLADSVETYGIPHWGKGYFGVNRLGHVTVHPNKRPDEAIDLKLLVDELCDQDYNVPILIRFADILRHRVAEIADAFGTAIAEAGYQGDYSCVYPIKVNQQRHVVEFLDFGKPFKFGLEAGSKPSCWPSLRLPMAAKRQSSAMGSRTTSSSRW